MQFADQRADVGPARLIAGAKLNSCSEFSCGSSGTFCSAAKFNTHSMEKYNMKKLGYVIAALGTFEVAAPSIASAVVVVIMHCVHDRLYMRVEVCEHWHCGGHAG